MKWKNDYSKEWVKRFALFPIDIDDTTVWFGFYAQRYVEKGTACECGCKCHIAGWFETELIENI